MLQDVNNTLISKFTERPDGELYDPDELLKREARKKRVQARLGEKKQMPLNEPKIANAYSGDAKFSHLSNFAPRDFVFEDKSYRNVEHAYQTNKSGTFDENVYNKYVRVSDVQYKIAGQKVDKEISIGLMEQIVASMYKQNPEAYQKLLDTKGMTIEHNIPNRQADIWTEEMPRILTALRDDGLDAFVKVTDELKLTKIISGMQKNVDQYGIEAAKILGLDYGGTVNQGFKVVSEGSNSPNFQEFVDSGKWEEIESQYYPDRTKANAQNADGTVWFGEGDSPGYGATKKSSGDKPWIENPKTPQELRNWMIENNIETLNVAGNRSYGTEEIGKEAQQLIIDAVQGNSASGAKAVENSVVKIFYPYSDKNSITNHANSYKKIMEEKYPNLTVEIVNNKSQADMVFGRGQGMGNPFSHESKHGEVIVKTRFFDETMIMYEAWLKGEPMPEGTVPITPEQQEKLNTLRNEWLSKTQKYMPGSSVGAAVVDDPVFTENQKLDPKFVSETADKAGLPKNALNEMFFKHGLKLLPALNIFRTLGIVDEAIELVADKVLKNVPGFKNTSIGKSIASKGIGLMWLKAELANLFAHHQVAAGTSTAILDAQIGNLIWANLTDTELEDLPKDTQELLAQDIGEVYREVFAPGETSAFEQIDLYTLDKTGKRQMDWAIHAGKYGYNHVGDVIGKGWNIMFPKDKDNE